MNTQRLLLDSYLKTLKLPTMRAGVKTGLRIYSSIVVAFTSLSWLLFGGKPSCDLQ